MTDNQAFSGDDEKHYDDILPEKPGSNGVEISLGDGKHHRSHDDTVPLRPYAGMNKEDLLRYGSCIVNCCSAKQDSINVKISRLSVPPLEVLVTYQP